MLVGVGWGGGFQHCGTPRQIFNYGVRDGRLLSPNMNSTDHKVCDMQAWKKKMRGKMIGYYCGINRIPGGYRWANGCRVLSYHKSLHICCTCLIGTGNPRNEQLVLGRVVVRLVLLSNKIHQQRPNKCHVCKMHRISFSLSLFSLSLIMNNLSHGKGNWVPIMTATSSSL